MRAHACVCVPGSACAGQAVIEPVTDPHPAASLPCVCVCMWLLVQAGPVIDAGGLFDFARASGMIKTVV